MSIDPHAEPWLQLNVALARPHGRSGLISARAVFARLAPAVARWRHRGAVTCFFFMRKPPDLRLRFQGAALDEAVGPEAAELLEALMAEGAVTRWFPSVYEPETRKFGGPGAMDAVHAHFGADSGCWIEWDALRAATEDESRLGAAAIATALANDLFCRALGDASEVWDVWSNCAAMIPPPAAPSLTDGRIVSLDTVLQIVDHKEAAVLRPYRSINQSLADRLHDEWSGGRLTTGLRGLLSLVAHYDFHRWGLGAGVQAEMTATMVAAWDPRRGLRV